MKTLAAPLFFLLVAVTFLSNAQNPPETKVKEKEAPEETSALILYKSCVGKRIAADDDVTLEFKYPGGIKKYFQDHIKRRLGNNQNVKIEVEALVGLNGQACCVSLGVSPSKHLSYVKGLNLQTVIGQMPAWGILGHDAWPDKYRIRIVIAINADKLNARYIQMDRTSGVPIDGD